MSTIDTPHTAEFPALPLAMIHITVRRAEIMTAMPPAFRELQCVLKAQDVSPTGPWFAHFLTRPTEIFDFNICSPVASPIQPSGRVVNGNMPAAKVIRTIHHGKYEGLPAAWGEFMAWIDNSGQQTANDLWETYLTGPFNNPDPTTWETQLNVPLVS